MKIDSRSKIPLYLQVYEFYKEKIVQGEFKSGEKLPSKRQLSETLGISINTVSKAYYLLEEEGFINPKERSGYFVEQLNNSFSKKVPTKVYENSTTETFKAKYDFSSSSIDTELFPYYTFSKLYKEVIESENENILINSETNGKLEFRKSISKYLRETRGLDTNPENIVISSGMEYLFEIIFYIFSNDKTFGIENPGYDILPSMIESRGFDFKSINISKEGIDISSLLKSNIDLLCVTSSHQFPTGNIMSINNRLEVLNWANSKTSRYIIEDDYDSEFKYVGKPIDPLKKLDTKDKVIYLGSFSKSLAPSLRISYMILPSSLIKILKEDAPFFICSVPVIEQIVMAKFIGNGHFERHLNKMRRIYKKKRELLIENLSKKNKVLDISGADSGLHIVVEFETDKTDEEILEKAKDKGIKIQSLSEFFNDKNSTSKSKFLLGFGGLSKDDLEEGVNELLRII